MSNIPEGLTAEMLDELVNNPGTTVSNAAPKHYRPTASIPLRGEKDLRPNVRSSDGSLANPTGSKVTTPNMDRMNAIREQEEALIRADRAKAAKETKDIQDALEPKKLLATINALSRKVNRLEKQIKEING